MTARAALLVALLVVASSTLAVAGAGTVGAQTAPGGSPPEETEDGATFTVSTQSLDLHQSEGGKICARKLAPDVNEVTITEATMHGVELYLGDEDEPKKVTAPSADVDETVLYTNGENRLVDLLATTGACITLDQDQQTVLEVYYQESGTLEMEEFQMVTGGTGSPPEPGGFTVPESILNDSSSQDGPTEDATETVARTTAVAGNATDQVGGTTDTVEETTENATEVVDQVENPTGTPGGALETVDDTTDTVTETVDGTTGTVNETVEDGTGTPDPTTETVDDATDAVEETTTEVGGTANDTTGTVDDTADSVTGTPGGTEPPVDDTEKSAEDATTEVRDTVEDTQTTATDTTTEVQETAEEVVPPTSGFGLSETVPTVGESVTLDASKSADPDGEIAKYEWDVDGDGSYERTGESVAHAFSEPGERKVTLRVTDDDGATDTATKTVRVNAPPSAAFSVVSDQLIVGEPVSLDGTKSSDPDGEIAKYEWDVDGDGNFEQTGAEPTPTFDSVGEHQITLRVTDDDGATDTTTKAIEVTDGLTGGDGTSTDDGDSSSDGDDTLVGAILP